MAGFGNVSGFSTVFGASPLREKLTGYENIYGEQLGQPALNNIKAPEIEAYKSALTDSPDFEPFMQQRKLILDLATKAQGAGLNITNPRTQDEVEYALLFNQEVEKYNQLGRQLEDQNEVRKQFLPNVGKEGVVSVMPQKWNTQGFLESVQRVPTPQDIRLAFPNMRFTTQEEVDEFNTFVPQMLDQMGFSYESLKNPELRNEVQRQFNVSKSFAGRGSLDREKMEELRQKNFALQTARINANKTDGGQPDFDNVIDQYTAFATSDDTEDVLNAFSYVKKAADFNKMKVSEAVNPLMANNPFAQYKEVEVELPYAVPLQSGGKATGVFATNNQSLANKIRNGEYYHSNGKILDKRGNEVALPKGAYFRWVSKYEIEDAKFDAADVYTKTKKTPLGAQQISTKYRTGEAESIEKPKGKIPMERNPSNNKITVDY